MSTLAREAGGLSTEAAQTLFAHWARASLTSVPRPATDFNALWARASQRKFGNPASTARYLNLSCALGLAFEDQPKNEWALAILSDDRLQPEAQLHQLVHRARHELKRRGEHETEALLVRTDEALLDRLDAERRAEDADAVPLRRVACDIDAVELRVQHVDSRREYGVAGGAWQRLAAPAVDAPVLVTGPSAMPAQVAVLSAADSEGPQARLQVRQRQHAGCASGHHPGLTLLDPRGLQRWQGLAAHTVGWPVVAPPHVPPATGLGCALAEETSPTVSRLLVPSCGLRDDGVPLGAMATQVWAYPARQWFFALQRDAGPALQWPANPAPAAGSVAPSPSPAPALAATPPAAPASRCRLEVDGARQLAQPWLDGFDQALPAALAAGLARLFEHWQATVQHPSLQATPGLLTGVQTLTWGWRDGPLGMAGLPVLRVLADLDLACSLDLQLGGELQVGGTRSRVRLAAVGQARLQRSIVRERPDLDLPATAGMAVLRWRFPFTLELDPVALEGGLLCSNAGPCTGAVMGEAGLRPRLSGGSGWQWYVRLEVEPVAAPLTVHDPVLGATVRSLALLPALPLLDWSLG